MNHLLRAYLGSRIPEKLVERGLDLNALVRELEEKLIKEALKQTGGNKQAAAKLLGLNRTTFATKLRRCGIVSQSKSHPGARNEQISAVRNLVALAKRTKSGHIGKRWTRDELYDRRL